MVEDYEIEQLQDDVRDLERQNDFYQKIFNQIVLNHPVWSELGHHIRYFKQHLDDHTKTDKATVRALLKMIEEAYNKVC